MKKFPCLQELPPTEPVDQGDEGEWDTVGEAAGSQSPAPCCSGEHGTHRCCCGRGSGRRGARGGARRGRTGGHRQHPRCPDRDGGPVKLVSVDFSRVVLDVVVVLG
jgi:hypothetical protein